MIQDNFVFINKAINDSYVSYMKSKDKKGSLEYNTFMSVVMRQLVLIYGENDFIEAYTNKDIEYFDSVLVKYGYSIDDVDMFKKNFMMFYKFDMAQKDRKVKKKNKFFNLVQKSLIDMMVAKNNSGNVDLNELVEFYDLLFTANSKDFYRKTYAISVAYNPYEIDNYFKKFYAITGE